MYVRVFCCREAAVCVCVCVCVSSSPHIDTHTETTGCVCVCVCERLAALTHTHTLKKGRKLQRLGNIMIEYNKLNLYLLCTNLTICIHVRTHVHQR